MSQPEAQGTIPLDAQKVGPTLGRAATTGCSELPPKPVMTLLFSQDLLGIVFEDKLIRGQSAPKSN